MNPFIPAVLLSSLLMAFACGCDSKPDNEPSTASGSNEPAVQPSASSVALDQVMDKIMEASDRESETLRKMLQKGTAHTTPEERKQFWQVELDLMEAFRGFWALKDQDPGIVSSFCSNWASRLEDSMKAWDQVVAIDAKGWKQLLELSAPGGTSEWTLFYAGDESPVAMLNLCD